jgi:hypothetical protein
MKLASLIFVIPLSIDQHHQFHGWLLAEAAVSIAIVTPLRKDCNFVVQNKFVTFWTADLSI